MSDKTDDTTTETNTGSVGNSKPSIVQQINAELDKKERDSVKAAMSAIVAEIRGAEKLIRVKTAELQRLQADFDAGIYTKGA